MDALASDPPLACPLPVGPLTPELWLTVLAEQQRRADVLARLLDTALRGQHVHEICETALRCLVELLQVDRVAALLYDKTGVLRFVSWIGLSELYRQAVEGHSPWTHEEKQPQAIFVEDAAHELADDYLRSVVLAEGIRSLAFFPLVCEDRILGKLMLYHNHPTQLSPNDVALVHRIADKVALAIARLQSRAAAQAAQANLERIVSERTFALEMANRRLAQQMADLESHRQELIAQQDELFSQNNQLRVARDRLADSECRFRAIVGSSSDGITLLDRESRIVEWNPALEAVTGINREHALGRPMWEVMWSLRPHHEGDPPLERLRTTFHTLLADPTWTEQTHVHVIQRPDGAVRIIQTRVFRIHGPTDFSVGSIVRDVTEQHDAQEQIRRYNEHLEEMVNERSIKIEQLERQRTELETLAATGRMAARIAHEINNPLAGVQSGFHLLKAAIPRDFPHHHFVARVESEIDRIGRIVRQMYGLYRPDKEDKQPFVVRALIDDVMQLVRLGHSEAAPRIEVTVEPGAAVVEQRGGLLKQVLYNLLQNALDVAPTASRIDVVALVRGGQLICSVHDQGPGIPEEVQQHIFEPFFTTKESAVEERLGLGLSVCQSAVRAMEGSIRFESEPGAGATFIVVMPVAEVTDVQS